MRIVLMPSGTTQHKENNLQSEVCEHTDDVFIEQCEKVLKNLPKTWQQYPDNQSGAMNIVDMEYGEFKQARSKEAMQHELVHLTSACLHLWRMLNASE